MVEWKSGDRVNHPLFGAGTVSAVAGSGADAKITVDFASNVGRKKLLASVANLRPLSSGDSQVNSGEPAVFVEALDAQLRLRRGGRAEREMLVEQILAECSAPAFWVRLRDKVRGRGPVPRMLDDPSGKVSLTIDEHLNIHIRVAHQTLNDARAPGCAAALLELLLDSSLREFQTLNRRVDSGVHFKLEPQGVLEIAEESLEHLPDREPRQRPKRVQPKGVIRSLPKRRDDY